MAQVNITEIRDLMYILMYRDVSNHIFYDTLPNTNPDEINNMVLLDFKGLNLRNNNAYGRCSMRIWLLALDSDNGNILADMETKFNDAIAKYMKSKDAAKIEIYHQYSDSGHDTNKKLRYYVKGLTIKIK